MRRVIAFALLLFASPAFAQDPPPTTPSKFEAYQPFPGLRIPRPVILTHAGDGTNRLFIGTQYGKILILPDDAATEKPQVFFDWESHVSYNDKENEEGLLGLAFHPKFRDNGEFFLYYTSKQTPHTSIISRFRVAKDDPNRADPNSEEVLLRIPQPAWNHNGGTLAFGPDGYLYIALGDGGKQGDPDQHGQNLGTLFGAILRIDVDHQTNDLPYAIPADNPFVGRDGARPEIFAYGFRNPWRIAFDRETGVLWAADVGEKTWEEIDLVEKGGNYGWSVREGRHPFGPNGVEARPDLIEPIWEYHHDLGRSITGGHVYRGKKLPELAGWYLYGDYVTGQVWALRYDPQQRKVVAHQTIASEKMPIITFGEDEAGEVYFTSDMGKIYAFRAKP